VYRNGRENTNEHTRQYKKPHIFQKYPLASLKTSLANQLTKVSTYLISSKSVAMLLMCAL
jgi:hypothetical protein